MPLSDTSDVVVGAVLQKFVDNYWQPLAYFSKSLTPTERRYSTFDRELLGIYLAIKHFRYAVEGRQFQVLTDQKPLTQLFSYHSTQHSPRQIRHLDYILQFTSNIRHVKGTPNPVADALSQIVINALTFNVPPSMNLEKVAQAQRNDPELAELMQSSAQHSLVLQRIPLPSSGNIVICDSNRDTTPICVHPTEELGFYSPVFIITPGNPEILCGQESTKTSESGHVSVYCVNALKYTNMLSLLSLAFLSQNIGSLICILIWLDNFLHLEDAPIYLLLRISSQYSPKLYHWLMLRLRL